MRQVPSSAETFSPIKLTRKCAHGFIFGASRAKHLTPKSGDAEITIPTEKLHALSINMGGNDVSAVVIVDRKMLTKLT